MEEPSLAAGPNGRGLGPGLATLPAGRRSILLSLKTRGEARAEELATDLGVTTSAVRQHLTALMRDGLVARGETRGGPGRPKHHYHLSRAADTLFPRTYPQVTNELLGYIGEDDPELLDRIFRRRRDRRIADARRRLGPAAGSGGPPAQPLEARVAELARILDEDGYVAS
ncbi:MAG: helix-turn-helix transcriptional regulator, partial [Acidimicrobiales bacterium]